MRDREAFVVQDDDIDSTRKRESNRYIQKQNADRPWLNSTVHTCNRAYSTRKYRSLGTPPSLAFQARLLHN